MRSDGIRKFRIVPVNNVSSALRLSSDHFAVNFRVSGGCLETRFDPYAAAETYAESCGKSDAEPKFMVLDEDPTMQAAAIIAIRTGIIPAGQADLVAAFQEVDRHTAGVVSAGMAMNTVPKDYRVDFPGASELAWICAVGKWYCIAKRLVPDAF